MIPENILTEEAKDELNKIKEMEKTVHRKNPVYRTNQYTYSFKNFQTIKTFGRDIYNGKAALKEADEDQSSLLVEITDFKKKQDRKTQRKSKRKNIFLKSYMHFLRVEKEF